MTNYYELALISKDNTISQFEVVFNPEIERSNRKLIRQTIENIEAEIISKIGPYVFKGTMMWACLKEPKSSESISFKSNFAEKDSKIEHSFVVELKKTKVFSMNQLNADPKAAQQVLQVLNSQLKKKMGRVPGLKEFNKSSKFYNVKNECLVEDSNLRVMKGYFTSIHLLSGQPRLLVDVSTRVLRNENFADTLKYEKNGFEQYIGRSVIADYGNYRIYTIEDILTKETPETKFDCSGKQVTFREYFKIQYGIEIKNLKQPLLKSSTKKKFHKDGKMVEVVETVKLVPELVKLTGMEDEERNNFQLMKKMAAHTKMEPEERIEKAQDLLKKLAADKDKGDLFTIKPNELTVRSFVLPQPVFEFGQNKTEVPKGGQLNVRTKLLKPIHLKSWALAYTSLSDRDDDDADDFVKIMKDAGKTYGITVDDPRFIVSKSKGWESFKQALDSANEKEKLSGEQMVITFVSKFETNWYPKIKKELLNRMGANHQNVRKESLKKNTMSIVSKILLQINAKVGEPLWKIQMAHPELKGKRIIVGGMAIYHKLVAGNKSCAAFVGTINNDLNKFYTCPKLLEMNQQRFSNLQEMIINWVKNYCITNKTTPEYIVVFREAVGEGSIRNILELEVEVVKKAVVTIGEKMKIPNYSPGVAFILVSRKINQRLFSFSNKDGQVKNPVSGTAATGELSSSDRFDYYLVPQFVNQGTATPTYFNVIYNTTNLSEDAFLFLTNEQCYNYYNWQGAVRVPAPLMYADKLATLVGDHLKEAPVSDNLKNTIYML